MAAQVEIEIVGTSPPARSLHPAHAGSAVLLRCNGEGLLLDCGPGAVKQMAAAGHELLDVDNVLLTHHHWDHVSDLPALVLGRWEQALFRSIQDPRTAHVPLGVYGPRRTQRICELFFGDEGVYDQDIATRLADDIGGKLYGVHGVKIDLQRPAPHAVDLAPGDQLQLGAFEVSTAEAAHCQPHMDSLAFRVAHEDTTVVYSGDTAPCEAVKKLSQGADVLLHEVGMREATRAKIGPGVIHTTASEVAGLAAAADVGMLVVVHHHIDPHDVDTLAAYEQTIRNYYQGRVRIAVSGDRLHVD